ncbi:saccharopine dehydrogenase (NAD+, L-lysine-forming) [Sporobolomyces salmoneus]|uniref:saccharopine dehydrogenase (NAD+, L-lysine-forming) n=1 Tax=Sporobolomyces salmoneus TaxID=183962 RepID=UPI00317C8C54
MAPVNLWLRCETKEFEHRAALTPVTAKKLIDAGFTITVERDPNRIFDDKEYEDVGCKLVEWNTWPQAPLSDPIIGLKELPPNDSTPLPHTHIMFAHCYKEQGGWIDVLSRWEQGQPTGMLYDLEFLQDESGRRVAAFGYHAGFAGAAVGALALVKQVESKGESARLGELKPYPNENELIEYVKGEMKQVEEKLGRKPRALVIGALGRCGRGAVDFFKAAGFEDSNIAKWDMAETSKGGPFQEILESDIFVNCIYLTKKIPSFVDRESIEKIGDKRQLRVVVDVSCDTTNPNNPIPIYDINTTFDKPTVDVEGIKAGPPLTVVSIDHLPTLLPREASDAFSNDLLPSLLTLPQALEDRKQRQGAEKPIQADEAGKGPERVWREAEALFFKKMGEMKEARK